MSNAITLADVERFEETPIVRGKNGADLLDGIDDGYQDEKTLLVNPSPLATPANVEGRLVYEGFDPYTGQLNPDKAMPGGVRGRRLYLRETFVRDIEDADRLLKKVFGGKYRMVVLDGFRSGPRQQLGFRDTLKILMDRRGIADLDHQVAPFILAGKNANNTFCYLRADTTSPQAAKLIQELRNDAKFVSQAKDFAVNNNFTLEDTLSLYVTVSANAQIGRAANAGVPLTFECNAHAGGGAADIMLVGPDGLLVNIVPFDSVAAAARFDFAEDDKNFDAYIEEVKSDPVLQAHLAHYGLTADTFTWKHWESHRAAMRVLYHLAKRKGWTYYSDVSNGENWHFEGGNRRYDVLTGDIVAVEPYSAEQYPDSGNAGHTFQVFGPRKSVAVWGGKSAHDYLSSEIVQ